MKINTKKQIEIELTLNETEAEYLLRLLQNYQGAPGAESTADNTLRREFFMAMRSQLVTAKE